MKCARWSCHLAVVPVDTRRQTGSAFESADFGGALLMVVDRLR